MFSSSSSSCNVSYLLLSVSLNVSILPFDFQEFHIMSCSIFPLSTLLFGFNFSFVSTRWWYETASAPLCTLTSCIDLLNFGLIRIWSIWFSVRWSVDTHVALWILLCGNTLPPIINLLDEQRSANISPFSFIYPIPCAPMTSSFRLLFDHIFAWKSPMSMVT